MRIISIPILMASAVLVLYGCTASGGSASGCARGLPNLEPPQAAPGKTFVLSGGGFGGGCDDSNVPFRPDPPQQDIRIEMRQEGETWHLDTVDADEDYRVETTLEVPKDAEPGRAVIVVPDLYAAEPMKMSFRVIGDVSG